MINRNDGRRKTILIASFFSRENINTTATRNAKDTPAYIALSEYASGIHNDNKAMTMIINAGMAISYFCL